MRIGLIAVCCVGLVSACSPEAALKRFTPPEHDKLARDFLNAVQAGDTDFIWKSIAPSSREMPDVKDSLRSAIRGLPKGSIDTLRQVGVNGFNAGGADRTLLSYELHTPAGWGGRAAAEREKPDHVHGPTSRGRLRRFFDLRGSVGGSHTNAKALVVGFLCAAGRRVGDDGLDYRAAIVSAVAGDVVLRGDHADRTCRTVADHGWISCGGICDPLSNSHGEATCAYVF
jgi:hypothetical protein